MIIIMETEDDTFEDARYIHYYGETKTDKGYVLAPDGIKITIEERKK